MKSDLHLLQAAMSRIEELPDDFDEHLNLSGDAPVSHASSIPFSKAGVSQNAQPTVPAAGAAAPEEKTADEILEMIKKTPLFMTDLGEAEIGTPALWTVHTPS